MKKQVNGYRLPTIDIPTALEFDYRMNWGGCLITELVPMWQILYWSGASKMVGGIIVE